MRLARLSRHLVAVVLAGGCGGPRSSPVLPVEAPREVVDAAPPFADDGELTADDPPPVSRYEAPMPLGLPAATDEWVPVSVLELLPYVRRPRGTVATYLDVDDQPVAIASRDSVAECGEGQKRCRWWKSGHDFAFVTAGHHGVVRDWTALRGDLRAFAEDRDPRDPEVLAFRALVEGPRPRSTIVWTNPRFAHARLEFPSQLGLAVEHAGPQRLDPWQPLPLDVPIERDLADDRIQRIVADVGVEAADAAMSPAERAIWHTGVDGETVIVRQLGRGYLVTSLDLDACGSQPIEVAVLVGLGEPIRVYSAVSTACRGVGGRRPPGLVGVAAGGSTGARLAALAHLEAASVPAFERVAGELAALGAPPSLVARAHAAAEDERRHAAIVGALAGARGAAPPPVDVRDPGPRDPAAIALDNAVDGCVHEAFAAVTCAYQAARAGDADVATAMRAIAADEARHGELAWSIAAWLEPRLSPAARARVTAARAAALAALPAASAALAAATPPVTARALGLPSADHARALATGFAAACA